MLTVTHPNAELAGRFRHIVIGLLAVVASYIAKDMTAGPLVGAIYMRLRRLSGRFDAVVARLCAGVPPQPRRGPGTLAPRVRVPDPLPKHRGWLAELLQHEGAAYGGYDGRLGYLLRDPAMVALLTASPDVGRVLRPLWRMLSKDKLPAVLRPAPRAAVPPPGKVADHSALGTASPDPVAEWPCAGGEPVRVDVSPDGPANRA